MARFRAFASDDEDDDNSSVSSNHSEPDVVLPKPQKPVARAPSISSSSSSLEDEQDEQADNSDDDSVMDERELMVVSEGEDGDAFGEDVVPWPRQLNLEPQRVHVMQTSLFRMPELASTQPTQPLKLKHPRSFDILAEPKEFPQRQSFAQPRVQAPSRKYVRVASSASISASHEGAFVDSGLSMGRSFRVGWGPGGKLVHLGGLCGPNTSIEQTANSSVIHVTSIRLSNPELPSSPDVLSTQSSPDILSHLLANTPIEPVQDGSLDGPYLTPNRDLDFSSFASLFDPSDNSHAASLFRLGHALFDPLNLHLSPVVDAHICRRVHALRRADALSTWLARAVAPQVEEDLKTSSLDDSARIAFLHLSGNQVEKAVEALTDGGNIRLATLVAQAPGDEDFRADIAEQLRIWRDEKVDVHINADVRRLYALLAGEVDVLEGSGRKEVVEVAKGLDWLRVLAIRVWFATLLDAPLQEPFDTYEQLYRENPGRIAAPTPWYIKNGQDTSIVTDGLFSLMKLALSPSMTLESTLVPLSFGPNPRDYKLPWFLYVLLSRCMRTRDFTDRDAGAMISDDESELEQERYSAAADTLTANFAAQLEQSGLVQEAVFVLLFLEEEAGRKRAIKDLLARSAPSLDDWKIAGIHGSLKIPREWIDEAQAAHAFYEGKVYEAYELYVEAGVHPIAHDLAVTYLAPEAVLRNDVDLLRSLFEVLKSTQIPDWGIGGQIFMDYAVIVTRVPDLRAHWREVDAVPDAAELAELETLNARIPKLIGILPDVLHNKFGGEGRADAALSLMLGNLLDCFDVSRPLKVEIPPGLIDEAARMRHVHSAAYGSFLKTIASVA